MFTQENTESNICGREVWPNLSEDIIQSKNKKNNHCFCPSFQRIICKKLQNASTWFLMSLSFCVLSFMSQNASLVAKIRKLKCAERVRISVQRARTHVFCAKVGSNEGQRIEIVLTENPRTSVATFCPKFLTNICRRKWQWRIRTPRHQLVCF